MIIYNLDDKIALFMIDKYITMTIQIIYDDILPFRLIKMTNQWSRSLYNFADYDNKFTATTMERRGSSSVRTSRRPWPSEADDAG